MRYDFGINDTLKITEKATKMTFGNCDETVIIVESFPEIDYVLAYRGGSYEPWVAAWGYNGKNCWSQGHYFNDFLKAVRWIQNKIDTVPFLRLEEIASKAIDGLIEDDPYEAAEYFENELELTPEEIEYFGIVETMDMIKGYEEDDDDN